MDVDRTRVLLIEDDEDDFVLVRDMLSEVTFSRYELEWVRTFDAALETILQCRHDVCLLDYLLGDRNGLDLLQEAIARGCRFPIIFLTGYGNYEIDLKAMKSGAADYLVKGQLTGPILERSIRYAVERKQAEEELTKYRQHLEKLVEERTRQHVEARADAERRAAEAEEGRRILHALMDYVPTGIAIADASDLTIRAVSNYALELQTRLYNHPGDANDLKDPAQWILYGPDGRTRLNTEDLPLVRATRDGTVIIDEELIMGHPGGEQIPTMCNAGPILDNKGNITGGISTWRDISALKAAQDVLRKANDELERRVEERTEELVQALESLNRSKGQLRFLSAQLLKAQEEERRRIARELHDSIGSALSAIKLSLANTMEQMRKGKTDPDTFVTLMNMTQNAIDDSRRLMTDLRPSILDDLGIVVTVRWFCRQCRQVYTAVDIEELIDIEEKDVPEPLKIVIFRILQEALNNMAKYSRASQATVCLEKMHERIQLTIEDNGIGFDPDSMISKDESTRGLGLTSMKERAELSGGRFQITSAPSRGTIVCVTWPQARI